MFAIEFPDRDGKALDSATLSHTLRNLADSIDSGNLPLAGLLRDHNGHVVGQFWYEVTP